MAVAGHLRGFRVPRIRFEAFGVEFLSKWGVWGNRAYRSISELVVVWKNDIAFDFGVGLVYTVSLEGSEAWFGSQVISGKELAIMKAKETAVVLIEFQNEFCKEDGKLYDVVKNEIARQGTIKNGCELAKAARSAYDRGYKVCVVKDATAATSKANQDYVESEIYPVLGEAVTVDEFIDSLE